MPPGDLPELAAPTPNLPKAAADQLNVQPWEAGLLAVARVRHRTIAWWHGYRAMDQIYGDFCYVCDRFVTGMVGNGNPSMANREALDKHKWLHRGGAPAYATINEKEAPTS